MNISQGFIERPIATSLFMAAIALFGTVAYRSLAVSDLPNVDLPTLLVTAQLPGANPDTMAAAVATPLENQFSMIAGLSSMTSTNSLGSTQVTLEFDLSRNLDGAAVDVQAAITQAGRLLPQGMPTPPTFTKVNPADQPILYIALTSPTLPLYTLDEYAETRVAQRISQISGVAQVQVLGAQKYAVHAQMDPHALAARQIGINEVESALRSWNVNQPTGAIVGPQRAFTLMASGQLFDAAAYRPLVVAYRKNSPVRLQDLGRIIDSVEDDKTASWYYKSNANQRSSFLGIQRQPGTNTSKWHGWREAPSAAVQSGIAVIGEYGHSYDHIRPIRESYHDVQFTMVLTLCLVAGDRPVSAECVCHHNSSLALPFSDRRTFSGHVSVNYSLDNLSMMALILSVGFVVDDAIVMLENIFRHMEMGESALHAALEGVQRDRIYNHFHDSLAGRRFIPVLFLGECRMVV